MRIRYVVDLWGTYSCQTSVVGQFSDDEIVCKMYCFANNILYDRAVYKTL